MHSQEDQHQTLMFSATISPTVNTVAKQLMSPYETVRVAKLNATADTIEHVVYPVEEKRKADLFAELIIHSTIFILNKLTRSTCESCDPHTYSYRANA